MAQETRKVIHVKARQEVMNEERAAAATITPGMLIERTSSDTVQAHSTAGGNQDRTFALEDTGQGNGIDDDYSSGDRVQFCYMSPGDIVNAILKDGEDIAIGDRLESAGDGTLQEHTADSVALSSAEAGSLSVLPNQIVGVAEEALDLSGSSGEESSGLATNPRLLVRIV